MKVVKNKLAPPFKDAETDFLYNEGLSREGDILDMGSEAKIIDKNGAWYSYDGERLGMGKEAARTFLKEHPEKSLEIEGKILEHFGIKNQKE